MIRREVIFKRDRFDENDYEDDWVEIVMLDDEKPIARYYLMPEKIKGKSPAEIQELIEETYLEMEAAVEKRSSE